MELKRQLGLFTAILIIIADVIGTGIFTTSGEVLVKTGSAAAVLGLFAVGGLIAITGSLCYSEMATMWPADGGEYVYLKRMYGLLPSFLTGWISLFIGFSLSAALSSIIAVKYLNDIIPGGIIPGTWLPRVASAGIIFLFSMIHLIGVRKGSIVQNFLTVLKLTIVFLIIILGFSFADWGNAGRLVSSYTDVIKTPGTGSLLSYGSSLIIIMYAFSGWNGTTYIAGEIRDPGRNLPRALFFGTLLITILYIGMNIVYLMSSSGAEIISMPEKETIGSFAIKNLFGPGIAPFFNICIVIILLSSVSVQMQIGPRVTYAMTEDRTIFKFLGRINSKFETPDLAIIVQMIIAMTYAMLGFSRVFLLLIYMGFSLSIFPLMAVIGMFYWRIKNPEVNRPFKVPFFPVVPLIYIILTISIIIATLINTPKPSLIALGVVLAGIPVFFTWQWAVQRLDKQNESGGV